MNGGGQRRWDGARMVASLVCACAVLLDWSVALAGRSPFGWVHATEVLPERGVELETWIVEQNGVGEPERDTTLLFWSPVIGVTDRLELALPFELVHEQVDDNSPQAADKTQLLRFGAEVRYRLVDPDPIEAGSVWPIIRVGLRRLVTSRSTIGGGAGFVLGFQLGCRAQAAVELSVNGALGEGDDRWYLNPASGISVQLFGDLRAGAELYADVPLDDENARAWLATGPSLAWTHGRFWMAAALLIGVRDIDTAPRINWGVAF